MFSQRLALEKLQVISQKTSWIPEYHSLSQIESFNSHFKELERRGEAVGKLDFEELLGSEEMLWIENEYRICAADYSYWSENYAFINANGQIERFRRRNTQKMLLGMWAELAENRSAIEQIILKARQQGISTEVEIAITWLINFGIGVKAAIASYDSDACERMAGMMNLAFNEQPSWMQANPSSDRAGALLAFGGNNTRLTMYSGKKAGGIARGDTPSAIHISEVSIFPHADDIIENSLFQSVHPTPKTFMILESTGSGNTNWWAKTWYSSRDYWASGGARLQPVFFPWFLADDIFPTETWRRDHPVPAHWQPLVETQRMTTKAAAYVHQTPLLRKFMGDGWRMPPWQSYFWEQKLLEYRRKDNENGWYQEMPMDDIEALRPEKELYFSLVETEKQDERRQSYSCWAIIGEQIAEKFHPDPMEIDYERERFLVTYEGHIHDLRGRSNKTFEWEFIPLKQPLERGVELFNANNRVIIFQWPDDSGRYVYGLGVDNSSGTKQDNSILAICQHCIQGNEPDIICATFASNTINPANMHPYGMAIAALYKIDNLEPLVGIEQVYGMGDVMQTQMLGMGYKRMYRFSRLDGLNPEKDKKKSKKLGWYTHEWSRNFMLSLFKNAVENHWLRLNDPFLIKQELPAFQVDQTDSGKTKFDHESGKKSDRIFAAGIAFTILNDTESMTRRTEKPFEEEETKAEVDYGFPLGYNTSYDQIAEELGIE